MSSSRFRERFAWSAIAVVLLTALGLVAFAPRLVAQETDESQGYLQALNEVMRYVEGNYVDADKATAKKLYEGALKGMMEALGDPYSVYLNAEESGSINIVTTGLYGGVGLVITKAEKVGAEVVSPIEGTPAYRAGISAGDMIVRIDGADISNLTNDQIANRLRGEPKSSVTVSVRRGESIGFDVTLVREVIEYPTVKNAMIPGGIGYVRISQFYPQTADRTRQAVREMIAAGMKSLIIDLRGNGGGTLAGGIDTADIFLSDGPIVSTRNERVLADNRSYEATRSSTDLPATVPVVVLIDKGSASAAEILAGALKDRGRAVLYGSNSYGKGSVQTVRPFGDGTLKLTTARYYTPGGYTIDRHENADGTSEGGVDPNVVVAEPAATPAEEQALGVLLKESTIRNFVRDHPQAAEGDIAGFVTSVQQQGIALSDRILRKLVRDEQNRTNNNPPVYDLEFDVVLEAAVAALRAGTVQAQVMP